MFSSPALPSRVPDSIHPLGRFAAPLRLARPLNCAMSVFAVLLGAWTVTRQIPAAVLFSCLACAALITAGGNTLNDYADAEIDRLNHTARPIPSGQISRRAAGFLAWAELALGLVAGSVISLGCTLIAFLVVALLIAYETAGLKKRGLPGNITIGLLTAMLFIMGGAAVDDPSRPASLAVLAFMATLGREIIKDIEDIGGDVGRRTWPMHVGPAKAKITAALLLGLAVILSPLPYFFGTLDIGYLAIITVANVAFVWTIVILFRSPRRASRAAKLAMLAVLGAILFGLPT
jgi:geranylgeranylglycerol-phosphate geranylgeranyltransferase